MTGSKLSDRKDSRNSTSKSNRTRNRSDFCRCCTADWNSDQLIRRSQTVFRVQSQRLKCIILQPIKDYGLPLLTWIY